ncbi:beta-glucosidase 5-like [Triticum dicoccoides]|uniref:beta-glucosidase 5-like n=1 Tax=Triticum dicoccoides TaxID=85692 RepID=UPI0018904512|nr:beta-glucosidase 5-like [Triticum dicoccoides]
MDGLDTSAWPLFDSVDEWWASTCADGRHDLMFQDDVKLMVDMNLEAYRFSVSWSRLIPDGRGAVNPKGLEYYNNLIDALVQHGIQVHIMIYQLDYPQILEDEYGGWLSPRIVDDFTAFADICFKQFGDRISYWTTIDEPNVGATGSYDGGSIAPGHCSDPFGATKCTVGDSTVEPYIAAHNMLLAHASASRLYREKYQAMQKGVVGLSIYSLWPYPMTNSTEDLEATKGCMDFFLGCILEPLISGDYPERMKKIVGSRLLSFTNIQSEAIIGSADFIGINHYYSVYVNGRPLDKGTRDYTADLSIIYKASKTDPPASSPDVIPSDPEGLQRVLLYLKEAYGDIPIYIQENGQSSSNDTLEDIDRTEYLKSYIGSTLAAVRSGANVKGYFAWAFLDAFECLSGYQERYGLYRVDFDDKALPRHARLSARWYSAFLKTQDIHVQSELNNTGWHAEQ